MEQVKKFRKPTPLPLNENYLFPLIGEEAIFSVINPPLPRPPITRVMRSNGSSKGGDEEKSGRLSGRERE